MVFDKKYNFLDIGYDGINGGEQIGASPKASHDYMSIEYTAREGGYIYAYVSNENATLVDVYFDDVVITQTKSNLIQGNEYYPYGLQTANSWTRENVTGNNYLANGGTEVNQTTQLYDLEYRNYDAVLGRMWQVDPVADKYSSYSPYAFTFNSPTLIQDINGADPFSAEVMALIMSAWNATPDVQEGGGSGGGANGSIATFKMEFGKCYDATYGTLELSGVETDQEGAVKSANFIFNFTSYGGNQSSSNWNSYSAKSMNQVLSILNTFTGTVNNLVLVSHGNVSELHLGDDILSQYDFREKRDDAKKFNLILDKVTKGGNVALIACGPGSGLAGTMRDYVRKDINIYINKDFSTINKTGLPFNENLTIEKDLISGWVEINSGHTYENLYIDKKGAIVPVKWPGK